LKEETSSRHRGFLGGFSGGFAGRKSRVIWKQIHGIRSSLALLIATALGAGLSPVAPGTMGTLMALPVAYFTRHLPWGYRLAFWGVLTGIGTWAAKVFDELMETNDNPCIVIDEVIGLGITSWTAGDDFKTWIAAFILFRFFDILKPPPVRQVDLWSKSKSVGFASAWRAGFGVIADDMIAGLQGLGLIILLQALKFLPA